MSTSGCGWLFDAWGFCGSPTDCSLSSGSAGGPRVECPDQLAGCALLTRRLPRLTRQMYECHADGSFERMGFVAGHTQHEMTSASAFESVFKYLEEMRLKTPEVKPATKKMKLSQEEEEVKMDLGQKDENEVEPKVGPSDDQKSVVPETAKQEENIAKEEVNLESNTKKDEL